MRHLMQKFLLTRSGQTVVVLGTLFALHGVGNAQNPLDQMDTVPQMTQRAADPVDFRRYRDLMPGALLGLEQMDCTGHNQQAQGMASSVVSCNYGEAGERVRIRFTDLGTMAPMMLSGRSMEFEIDSDDGFERSTSIAGFQGSHSWHEPAQSSKVTLQVGDRGLLEIDADELGSDGAVRAARTLPLQRLAALASGKY